MKHRIVAALALLVVAALSVFAMAEELNEAVEPELSVDFEAEAPDIDVVNVDPEIGEADGIFLGEPEAKDADSFDFTPDEGEAPEAEAPDTEEDSATEPESDVDEAPDAEEDAPAEEKSDAGDGTDAEDDASGENEVVSAAEAPDGQAEAAAEESSGREAAADAEPAGEAIPEAAFPAANALTYTGEAQALVSAEGDWLYSLDGERYATEIPTGIDAGEYAVYFRPVGDDAAEAETLTVVIAKADVVFMPPVAATGE